MRSTDNMMHVIKFNLFIFNFKISKIKVNFEGFLFFQNKLGSIVISFAMCTISLSREEKQKTLTLENQISEVVLTFILSIIIGSLVGVTAQI